MAKKNKTFVIPEDEEESNEWVKAVMQKTGKLHEQLAESIEGEPNAKAEHITKVISQLRRAKFSPKEIKKVEDEEIRALLRTTDIEETLYEIRRDAKQAIAYSAI